MTTHIIPDTQSAQDARNIAIDRVGIKGLRHPISVIDRSGIPQPTIATLTMSVSLAKEIKGTHMSRFVAILNEQQHTLSVTTLKNLLQTMQQRLESASARVEIQFPYFINKRAPITGTESLMDYQVTLIGHLQQEQLTTHINVVIPITSLCPCSKAIADYGAHNQRAHVAINAQIQGTLWIEDLIELAEKEASSELFSLLKRPDEKYVTEKAYDNPKFVEDVVRDIAHQLNIEKRIKGYTLEVENFEAIHNHSAYAAISVSK